MPARAALLPLSLITLAALGMATPPSRAPFAAKASGVELRIATLHAAVLTSPNAPQDSVDAPYLLVSIVGPQRTSHALTLPAEGHWRVHRDEALGARALETLRLDDGDSVRVLVTVMEGGPAARSEEDRAAAAAAHGAAANAGERDRIVSAAVEPLVSRGARWVGSASLLLTREAGVSYWRGLGCVTSCKVVSGGQSTALNSADSAAPSGVIELSGAGATYHVKLEARERQ